ncbi:MAG: DUF2092 domain-containing protein [Planctomycetota bacterium]
MKSPLNMMLSVSGAVCLLFVVVALASGCQQDGGTSVAITMPPDEQDSLAPEELLTEMAAFMAAHDDYAFEALVTYQSLQESGQTLHFDMIQSVAVSQPDRLFWTTLNDDASSDKAWYSAGQFSMLKQPDNIYGQIDVPATIPEMIDVVTNDYGIVVPFSDLLASGDESVFLRDLEASEYVGLAWVEGAWSHHLALRNELVDFEVWMQAEGDPIPLKLAITWKLEEGLPAYVARFREWNFSPILDESQFHFNVPSGAELIEILPMDVAWEVEQ